MGAALTVPFARATSWPDALARVRAAGFTLIALTPDAPGTIAALRRPPRTALVVGAEGTGLGRATREATDLAVAIPMASATATLNVATAAAVALYLLAGSGSGDAS
jgi:tRNA G18 (ribose-2'-O)-methylase SpoU